jgi:ligand-binding sensor domain-containing protein
MSLISLTFTKSIVIIALFSLSFLCCGPFAPRVVQRPEVRTPEEISSAGLIAQEVKVLENPLSGELINCAVVTNVQNDNPWVKIEREEVKSINIIEGDANGRMWLATDGHGLTMFDGVEWHNWQPEAGRDMGYVAFRTMAVSDEKVYAGAYSSSSGGNLLTYDIAQDKWDVVKGLSGNVVGGVTTNQQGQLFAATSSGVDTFAEGKWSRLQMPLSSMFTKQLIDDAVLDISGNYWMATVDGIWKYDGKSWEKFAADNDDLPSNEVNAIAVDGNNRIWAATANGLAVYESGNWRIFSAEKYPWFSGWLNDVAVDSAGRIWVLRNDFLTVYNGKEVAIFEPGAADVDFWDDAIGFDKQGCVWVDGPSELVVLRGKLNMEGGQFNIE